MTQNNNMNNNRGMALVVALMSSFLLLALVASLFWVISSTSRQAEYARNSAIALNLAEAGTADAIYRLNYCTGSTVGIDNYPFLGSTNPFGTSASWLVNLSTDHDILTTSLFPTLIVGANSGITGTFAENGGVYYVGIADNTYSDTLIAVGIYKGIRRILTTSLRGNNVASPSTPRQEMTASTQGISEVFNKHAIYADIVTATGTTTVNGNIAYKTSSASPSLGTWTKTIVAPATPELFAPSIPNLVPAAISVPLFSLISNVSFQDNDWATAGYQCDGSHGDVTTYGINYVVIGAIEIYTLTSANLAPGIVWKFEQNPSSSGIRVVLDFNSYPGIVVQGKIVVIPTVGYAGDIYIYGTGNIGTNSVSLLPTLSTEGSIGSVMVAASSNVTIYGNIYGRTTINVGSGTSNIHGILYSDGTIDIGNGNTVSPAGLITDAGLIAAGTITLAGGTINGGVSSGSGIDITGAVTIDSSASDTALLVSSAGSATVTISAVPTLTLGPEQTAALSVFSSSGNATVNINAAFNPIYDNTTNQAAIVSYAPSGNSVVNLNANTGAANNSGPIYSVGLLAGANGITTGAIVYGSLITNGTVALNNLSSLTYEPSAFTGANSGSDIFAGFGGGRRVYVPVWQWWRLK